MLKKSLFLLPCKNVQHQRQECTLICLNKHCKEHRICCLDCLKNNMHSSHLSDLEQISKIDSHIEEWQDISSKTLKKLDDLSSNVQQKYQILKQGIVNKYYLSFSILQSMTNNQLNDAINNLINFKSFEKPLLSALEQCSADIAKELNQFLNDLELESLTYSELSEKEVQKGVELFNQGLQSYYENDFQSAIQLFEKSIAQNPNNTESKIKLKETLQSMQIQQKQRISSNSSVTQTTFYSEIIEPKSLNNFLLEYFEKAESLKKYNQYTNALQIYEKALNVDEKHLPSLKGKGECLLQLGKYKESLEIYNQALKIDQNDAESLEGKGECLRLLKSYNEALVIFEKVLQIDQSKINSQKGKGDCLRQMDCYMDAVLAYEKVLAQNFQHIPSLWGKGDCLRMLGKLQESLEYYERALQFDPKHVLSLTSKGESLRMLNRMQEAFQCYDQALTIDPNNVFTLSCKGQFLMQVNQYREAEALFNLCLQLNPNSQYYLSFIQQCQDQYRFGSYMYH